MDSDYSDVASEGSEVPYQPGADEQDDDDEEYVEVAESQRKPKARATKRSKSSASSASKPVATRNRSKEQGEDDFEEEELEDRVSSSKRRNLLRGVPDEDDETEETPDTKLPSEEGDLQTEPPSDQVELEDESAPQSAAPDDEEELRENTEDAIKGANRSKMLTDLLGDGNVRKSLTEEEVQLRRAENARKRKNLSEKRLEEEKQETINKLLRRRAGKSRSHLPREDDKESLGEASNFYKPRRPYITKGMNRTLRSRNGDCYCLCEKT
ncbi:ZYBA0S04-00848g1_1 [Zygosaccharomyces bailii CLIB 213]|uniref:ZYBA0S04-00848g1_1 n=1 Tax=Zygosaccharomyces bailii (strain CLIB 213 / ATCC 58445 / CBS 680 / BCRC 21525 / NBRC 1098 / NCYC 1416 / NRRL Y-2227) TaxID=1333698 RepID=A0A8J2WZ85_ZYGB2|nr:ZYBA0S04-00848g1_1 [Zygosaccharomyces bailii CLIB 213]